MNQRFEDKHVRSVPEKSGTFCLWDHAHLVYIGRTAPRIGLAQRTIEMAGSVAADRARIPVALAAVPA